MNEEACGMLFKQIHNALLKDANEKLAPQRLTLTQVSLLNELSRREKATATMKELEAVLSVAQPTVVGIVKRLEQKGFVSCHDCPDNRRVKMVMLTELGWEQCRQGLLHTRETEERMLRLLTPEERQVLPAMLTRVLEALQE